LKSISKHILSSQTSTIPGGAVSEDWTRWISYKNEYLFNEEALGLVFRGKFINYMTKAYHSGKLHFPGISAPYKTQQGFQQLKDDLYSNKWVVSVREAIKRPEYVLEYLGRYTHRVAISNHRIVSLKDGMVTFKYKNRKTNQMEETTGIDITLCPCCKKGKMQIIGEIPKYTGVCANEIIRPPN
jgi:hypothetical protein